MEHFTEFEPDHDLIEPDKVVQTVVMDPKKAFRFIHKYQYENHLKALLVLGGVSNALDRAVTNNSGDSMSLGAVLGMALIFGGLLGWISYYIYSALISWSGGWLNGKARTSDILRVLAYANIPIILSLIVVVVQVGVFGIVYFQSYIDLDSYGIVEQIIFYGCSTIEFSLAMWSIVLVVIGVAEAQQFTIGKALLNIILPVLVIAVPILLIVLIATAF